MGLKHSTTESFSYAFSGIKTAFKKEPNFRIHAILALIAIGLAFFLRFNAQEWIILFFTIGLVVISELVNTALEAIVNLVSPEVREEAKIAKDISAAAVFVSASIAIIVGFLLFLPKLY